jgi:20S proteasome alpha/beta subunit
MTIAAGFCYSGGVLVCADSQFTIGTSKVDGLKAGGFTASWGEVVAAFAGNATYASGLFHQWRRQKEYEDFKKSPVDALAARFYDHYQKHVHGHPEYKDKSAELDYAMFVGVRTGQQTPQLFIMDRGDIRDVGTFNCAGSGEEWARTVLRYLHSTSLSTDQAVCLASYILAHTKHRAQYVGGRSSILLLTSETGIDVGKVEWLNSLALHTEYVGNWFAVECERFLLHHALARGMPEFAHLSNLLQARMTRLYSLWESKAAIRADAQSSTDDWSGLPPWPE